MLTRIVSKARVSHARRSPCAFSQTIRWISHKTRCEDGTLIVKHNPAPGAPRLAPTPIVLIGSTDLECDGGAFLAFGDTLCSEASFRGFSCFQFDLAYKRAENADINAKEIMDRLASHLRSLISTAEAPFPPVLYARQLGCLIAQTYVSSYPVSALILDSPPLSCGSLSSWPGLNERFPLPLPEFTYEPKFPILVMERRSAGGVLKNSRLAIEGADYTEVCENRLENGVIPNRSRAVEQWIDELGF
ncbi:hypothetical protein EW145_g3622 [Phellinidium pouzarii]|uniref:Uncharacterized protein n=1 Tax=Phellinidium pouzarii TaxID=167371 RepID=A0A4S4L7Z2_9AGAM|nr:hypothetical protein EW145_g3622 [Phellinidium pouzarii]